MNFRPCIDLHNGKVKQIVGSTLTDESANLTTNFETDLPSSYFAGIYKKDNITGGHVIMLGKGNEEAARSALTTFPGGLQVGGGINTLNAKSYLDDGASHVIVTSYVFHDGYIDWTRIRELADTIGKNRLVLDLSCKKRDGHYFVVTDRWQKFTDTVIGRDIFAQLDDYCDEFLVHAADVEGKQGGIDTGLVSLLSNVSLKPITYAGGIRSISDLEVIRVTGKGHLDATIGSALDLFGGTLKYTDVVKWFREQQVRNE
ncbi:MAG: phosphoribosylformimino-5-aminoimidazole carboxamide ribotide isomerase [Fibrobacter sp.]|nr:phosphoribosylformimino-5-aminoimidazole carboxamide ribotide isomerase [Fibrobacter sp.]